jgi:hypothetical protein
VTQRSERTVHGSASSEALPAGAVRPTLLRRLDRREAAVDVDDDVSGGRTGLGAPEQGRSGDSIEKAVERFEAGTQVEGDHTPVGRADTGESRLEQMTEVEQTGTGDPAADGDEPDGPEPQDVGSGGAQRVVGPRIPDQVAGGGPVPATPSGDGE